MTRYFIMLSISILMIFMFSSKFVFARGLSFDYWNEKRFNTLRHICGAIGVPFLVAIVFICIFDKNRFSKATDSIVFWIMLSEMAAMLLYSMVISLIAWKKKTDILKRNIQEMLKENEGMTDKQQLLKICLNENRENFTQKQIKRNFTKIVKKESKTIIQ